MITMNMEGITWVGNIYQKFEAICLEVEEIMYEDTVKYVENQVQTVGASVKRFYSDVVQDLIPPCPEESAKGPTSDFPVKLYNDVHMKARVGMKEKHVKVDSTQQLSEDPKLTGNNEKDHPHIVNGLLHVDNLFPISQRDSAGGESRRCNRGSVLTNSKTKNLTLNGASGAIASFDRNFMKTSSACVVMSLDKDLIRASTTCKSSNKNHDSSSNHKANNINPESAEIKSETKNVSEHFPDISTNKPSSNMINLVESRRSEGMKSSVEPDGDISHDPIFICTDFFTFIRYPLLTFDLVAADVCISLVESFAKWNVQSCSSSDNEDFVSNSGRSDDGNTYVMGDDTSVEQDMEIIQHDDQIKLDETCIMVSGDELRADLCKDGKCRSYKKKIRNVFSSRKKSARKQEYEQLALLYGGDSKSNADDSMKSSISTATRSPDFCDSEWEVL